MALNAYRDANSLFSFIIHESIRVGIHNFPSLHAKPCTLIHSDDFKILFTAVPMDRLLDGDMAVEVLVEGLDEHGRISVKQVGDDAQLTCKAIKKDTNEILTEDVRFGWEWRYLDNDPAMTSNVAVGIKTDGDSMELRGIRAPEGLGGRGIKGRCVLHIPAKKIEPEATDGDKERKFTSHYFMVVVDRVPVTIQPPIPGHAIGK